MTHNVNYCVDLQTVLQDNSEEENKLFKSIPGVLTRMEYAKFQFVETPPVHRRRNPKIYQGRYLSVTAQRDGGYRINIKPIKLNMALDPNRCSTGIYYELATVYRDLIHKGIPSADD